ncbi:VOC family protein [uncultured Sphingopyxis sp.]|jgi:catechol 2,3-dioxygenase-like lactoylglutathione lyase family enzyme|uniref:VOC family protein n=1 Tax=uncultured Sphingopyxis sp. TaxID=310581 RepID=UPI000AA67756|nr:VOC family protein [uncultured Sphingopyxis sp.]
MTNKSTTGAHHIGLAVPDLEAARDFFTEALGFAVVGERPSYPAIFVSDGTTLLTMWRVEDPATATHFDRRKNIGLHHLALGVADHAALGQVFSRVEAHPGVRIEFPPQPIAEGAQPHHFVCFMPGGLRIEFATPF